jgi:hypothetical protein
MYDKDSSALLTPPTYGSLYFVQLYCANAPVASLIHIQSSGSHVRVNIVFCFLKMNNSQVEDIEEIQGGGERSPKLYTYQAIKEGCGLYNFGYNYLSKSGQRIGQGFAAQVVACAIWHLPNLDCRLGVD